MDIKKPLFITILIVAFCIAGIVYIRMTKKPVPAPAPAEIAVKKKENKPAQEVKKELPAIKEEQPENKYLPLKTASGDISAYLDLNFNREPYKTVCLGYEGQTCTSNASLYASGNGKAVLYKVCSGTENGVPENCSKNILAVYNDKEKITDLYICNPKALFGQCGNWQERK